MTTTIYLIVVVYAFLGGFRFALYGVAQGWHQHDKRWTHYE